MSNVAHIEAARVSENFLSELYKGKPDDAAILIWTLENKCSHWFETIPSQAVINKLATGDTFFGLGLAPVEWVNGLSKKQRPMLRCKADNVVGIPGLWIDVDYKNSNHKKTEWLPECDTAWELTMSTLSKLGITPSISVGSGHGFHFYILFERPWIFRDRDDHLRASEMSHRLSEYVKAEFHKENYAIDSVYDLARILRLPGTNNCKDEKPVPATIIEGGTTYKRYSREELRDALANVQLPVIEKPKKRTAKASAEVGSSGTAGITLSPSAEVPLDKHEALAANEPHFAAVWERKKNLKDNSPSGYDMSLACYAAIASWSDQEIVNLLIHHRRKHGSDLKIDRIDYYQATISKARRIVCRSVAMNNLETVHDRAAAKEAQDAGIPPDSKPAKGDSKDVVGKPPITDEMREEIVDLLAEILGFGLTGIQKFNTMPPEYYLTTDSGDVHIGEVNFLMSQTQFAHKVAAACGVALQPFSSSRWQTIKQRLLDACKLVDVGEEAREDGLLKKYMHEFMRVCKPSYLKDKACCGETPFIEDERVYLFGSRLRIWIRMQHMQDMTPKKIGVLLKQIGCIPTIVNMNINGKRTTKSVWKLPEEFNAYIPEGE